MFFNAEDISLQGYLKLDMVCWPSCILYGTHTEFKYDRQIKTEKHEDVLVWMYWKKNTWFTPCYSMLVCWKVRCYDSGMVSTEIRRMIELTKLSKPKKIVQRGAKTWQNSMARSSRISGDANSIIKLIQIGLLAGGFRHFLFSIIYGIILPID